MSGTDKLLQRIFLIGVVAVFLALALGCAKRKGTPIGALDEAWMRAKNYMKRERFVRAQGLLRDIVLNYSGSSVVDSAQFFLGLATYELNDYLVAAEEFRRVTDQYPFSELAGDAVYFEALSYFQQSPKFPLDQTLTDKALRGFQRFLEDYPDHALTDSSYRYLGLCRDKLARKEYAAARLYYDLGEYASALLYCGIVLDNYYDTPLAASAQFLKGRSYFALKDWEKARRELDLYLERYPDGRFTVRARQMLGLLPQRIARSGSTASEP
ncbi:outer membrane protein assembly factor BamD [bacterium]|nr:outer membrane protein assembly factor BamD [bacterium]MBU1983060.1 outer membrane protein assembly factor BamD [bacterium]